MQRLWAWTMPAATVRQANLSDRCCCCCCCCCCCWPNIPCCHLCCRSVCCCRCYCCCSCCCCHLQPLGHLSGPNQGSPQTLELALSILPVRARIQQLQEAAFSVHMDSQRLQLAGQGRQRERPEGRLRAQWCTMVGAKVLVGAREDARVGARMNARVIARVRGAMGAMVCSDWC